MSCSVNNPDPTYKWRYAGGLSKSRTGNNVKQELARVIQMANLLCCRYNAQVAALTGVPAAATCNIDAGYERPWSRLTVEEAWDRLDKMICCQMTQLAAL